MAQETPETALTRIERPLRLTLLGLWAERLARAFWPLWSLVFLALALGAFGFQDLLPLEASWFVLVGLGVAGLWALVRGLRSFRRPTRAEALIRLDGSLPGRPIAALLDTLALGDADPTTRALWAAHRARMAERAATARAVEPDLDLASRDPFAFRYMAATLFGMALLFGSLWQVASVGSLPGPGGDAQAAAGPAWEGWAEPPAYTRKPTLYLRGQTDEALILPQGTRIRLRFYGAPGALILAETVSGRTEVPPASDMAQDFLVTRSGRLEIEGTGGRNWLVTMVPDAVPAISPQGLIDRDAGGRFRQGFTASDDYGVTRGEAEIGLDLAAVDRRHGLAIDPEPVAPVVLDLPLPQKRERTSVEGILVDDLSKSVLSNLPATLTLKAGDAAGQSAESAALHVTLPGRRFFEPVAAAVIEQRRDLMWNRANAPRIADLLRAITWEPESALGDGQPDPLFRDRAIRDQLRALIQRLEQPLDDKARDAIAEEMWALALQLEEGDLADARARLDRAQDRLDEAIRNGASPAEIDRLMKDMREALNDWMKQEAEKNPNGPDEPNSGQQGQTITQDQLQQMLDRLQQLMKEGRMAEAQQLMEQLRQMMENMQVQEGQGQGEGQGQAGPGQQAMRDLGQTLRDQQGLSDDAFRDMQQGGQGGEGLAQRQQELRDRIEGMREGGDLPGAGTELGDEGRQNLDDAGRAMEEAERMLREGDLPGALDRQAEALEALREGIKNLGTAQQLAENDRAADGESFAQEGPEGQRDPLGRETGEGVTMGSDAPGLQGEDVYRRAQELLDEIRKRAGEQERSAEERGYLRRLLDMF